MIAAALAMSLMDTPKTEVRPFEMALNPVKKSPLRFTEKNIPFEFEWMTEGLAQAWSASPEQQLRFRVFAQDRKVHGELSPLVTRTLLRLWTYNYNELKIDHKPDYARSCVDVYLCWSGQPGGEHLFDEDPQAPRGGSSKVNTIYIYDLPTFKEKMEQLREVAHEYGHATLPAIGGYDYPEYWANGFLGEKLFLSALCTRKDYDPDQMMGVSQADCQAWVREKARPLMFKAAQTFPTDEMFKGKGESSMNQYIGYLLWVQFCFEPKIVSRLMKINGEKASTLPTTLRECLEDVISTNIPIHKELQGKLIWLPDLPGTWSGCTIKLRKKGFVGMVPTSGTIRLRP
ncbi:MAG: hypothetical protein QE269_13205 [Fimbriimonas sp.]|nr:hypothetical protein [Fimbriimonas sp.]